MRFTLLAIISLAAASALGAPYDVIVIGDTNAFPVNTAGVDDIDNTLDCYNGLQSCLPGCDHNFFPYDLCNPGDIAPAVDYLNGGPLAHFPSSGYIDFAPLPSNPSSGSGDYGVIVTNVSQSSGFSGFVSAKGEFQIQAAIVSNTAPASTISAPSVMAPYGNGLVSAGQAQGQSFVTLSCNGPGPVTLRYFTQVYAHSATDPEICLGGASCPSGAHYDQFDLVIDCVGDCLGQPDGTPCGDPMANACTAPDVCTAGICLSNDSAAGTPCGDQGVECLADDACDGAGSCVDNGFDDGASCASGNGVSDCSGIDTCLSGVCLNNDDPVGSPCGDQGVECLADDACDGAGSCVDNGFEDGASCASGNGVSDCSGIDTCLSGVCLNNDDPAGSPCGNQGVECFTDDACDGVGTCVDNGFDDGAPCISGNGTSQCSGADTCLSGICMDNDLSDGSACTEGGGIECCGGACVSACGSTVAVPTARKGTSPGYPTDYNNGMTGGPGGPTDVFTILPNDPAAAAHGVDSVVFDIAISPGPLGVGDAVFCNISGIPAATDCGPGDSACFGWGVHPEVTGGGIDTVSQQALYNSEPGIGTAVAPDELDTGTPASITCSVNAGPNSSQNITVNMGFIGFPDQTVPAGTTDVVASPHVYCSNGATEYCTATENGLPQTWSGTVGLRGVNQVWTEIYYDPAIFDIGLTSVIPHPHGRTAATPYFQPGGGDPAIPSGNCNVVVSPPDVLCKQIAPGILRYQGDATNCNGAIMVASGGCILSASTAPPVGTVTALDASAYEASYGSYSTNEAGHPLRGVDITSPYNPLPSTNVTGYVIWD